MAKSKKGGGGNARDRAVKRAAIKGTGANNPTGSSVESQSESAPVASREWLQPLNRADSIGLLGVLIGVLFVIVVPTVWYKAPALLLLCFGFVYFIWQSHWTHHLKSLRFVIAALILVPLNIQITPQLIKEWHLEHMRSQLVFDASATGIQYPVGKHFGIDWDKISAEVRLTVISKAPFPINNLNLSIWTTDKKGSFAGMARTDPDTGVCSIGHPKVDGIPSLLLHGQNGNIVDIAPWVNDTMDIPWADHYNLSCQRISAGESISLVIKALSGNRNNGVSVPPSQIRITGYYETTAPEGSRRISVNEVVPVAMPLRWK